MFIVFSTESRRKHWRSWTTFSWRRRPEAPAPKACPLTRCLQRKRAPYPRCPDEWLSSGFCLYAGTIYQTQDVLAVAVFSNISVSHRLSRDNTVKAVNVICILRGLACPGNNCQWWSSQRKKLKKRWELITVTDYFQLQKQDSSVDGLLLRVLTRLTQMPCFVFLLWDRWVECKGTRMKLRWSFCWRGEQRNMFESNIQVRECIWSAVSHHVVVTQAVHGLTM